MLAGRIVRGRSEVRQHRQCDDKECRAGRGSQLFHVRTVRKEHVGAFAPGPAVVFERAAQRETQFCVLLCAALDRGARQEPHEAVISFKVKVRLHAGHAVSRLSFENLTKRRGPRITVYFCVPRVPAPYGIALPTRRSTARRQIRSAKAMSSSAMPSDLYRV